MKILYFAQIKESIGKDQDIIEFKSEISINELIEELISKGEKYKLNEQGAQLEDWWSGKEVQKRKE